MTEEEARRLLIMGRAKQHLPRLTAVVRVEAQLPRTLKLLAKADGPAWRKLVVGWYDYRQVLVGFLLNGPAMRQWTGDGQWRNFGFDLSRPLEGTSVVVRDMLPIPVEEFAIEYRKTVPLDSKEAAVLRLTPRSAGKGLLHQEIWVFTGGPEEGLEGMAVEYIDGSWDPQKCFREVRASWTQLPSSRWLSLRREIRTVPTEAIVFLGWDEDTEVEEGSFNGYPSNPPPRP